MKKPISLMALGMLGAMGMTQMLDSFQPKRSGWKSDPARKAEAQAKRARREAKRVGGSL